MRLTKNCQLILFLFLFIYSISAFAMAWLQPQGDGVLINNATYYDSCRYWSTSGNLQSGPCFTQAAFNPYFEYGLFPKLTVGVSPFFQTFSQAGQTSTFNFDNSVFFARLQLEKSTTGILSTQISYNQAFISSNFGNPTSTSTSSAYTIANLQNYTDFRLLYGLGSTKWYLDLESAYRNYYEGAASELHFDFVFGWKFKQGKLITEIQELNTVSMHNPTNSSNPNFDLCTIQPDVIYWFHPQVAIEVGVKQDFYGWNVGMGTQPFLALWYKF